MLWIKVTSFCLTTAMSELPVTTNIRDKNYKPKRTEVSKVGSVCASYRHMYETIEKAKRISIVSLTPLTQ